MIFDRPPALPHASIAGRGRAGRGTAFRAALGERRAVLAAVAATACLVGFVLRSPGAYVYERLELPVAYECRRQPAWDATSAFNRACYDFAVSPWSPPAPSPPDWLFQSVFDRCVDPLAVGCWVPPEGDRDRL